MTGTREAGWYEDPSGLHAFRYYDGAAWTAEVRNQPHSAVSSSKAGWYPDPAGSSGLRYFDGQNWSNDVRPRPEVPVSDPRLAAAVHAPQVSVPNSTVLKLSRSTLADLARSDSVLAEGVVEKSSRRFSTLAVVVGVLVLAYGFYATVLTNWIGERAQEDLREQYTASLATPTPVAEPTAEAEPAAEQPPVEEAPAEPAPPPFNREPKPTLLADGTPTGIIRIPAIGVDQVFVSGTKVPDLKKGPGVWEYGAFPGTPGNATISGHRTTYGGPFRNIDKLNVGDQIIVSVEGQPDAVFEVRGKTVVAPSRIEVTNDTPGVRLTLTTCEPVGSDAERLVVQAELVSGAWADHALPADQWQIVS